MRSSELEYELPPELIAQQPAAERDASRLLHVPVAGPVEDRTFRDIVELLPADSVLVANDTRVLAARVLVRLRPRAILATGAGVSVPFAWVGRLFGARIVFVESMTRIESPSLSCRLIRPAATRLLRR